MWSPIYKQYNKIICYGRVAESVLDKGKWGPWPGFRTFVWDFEIHFIKNW